MKLFVIAGHGAGDSGACGGGYTEAERVRALAKKMEEYGGDAVLLGDVNRNYYADNGISNLDLPEDTQIMELHMDSAVPSAKGGHIIIKKGFNPDAYDKAVAKYISTVFPGRSEIIAKRGNLANANRAAIKGYAYRLVECGFISNENDLKIFNSKIDEIAINLLKCYGITKGKEGWKKDNNGWWYQRADGSYPHNEWVELDTWYWFNESGYAVTGWKWINGKCYYFDKDCHMISNAYIQSTSHKNRYHWVNAKGEWDSSQDSWDIQKYKHIEVQ